jgi:hypothetical protein
LTLCTIYKWKVNDMHIQLIFHKDKPADYQPIKDLPVFDLGHITKELTNLSQGRDENLFVFVSEDGLRPEFGTHIPGSAKLAKRLMELGIERISIHKPPLHAHDQMYSIYLTLNMMFSATLLGDAEKLEENLRNRGFEVNEYISGKKTLFLNYSTVH